MSLTNYYNIIVNGVNSLITTYKSFFFKILMLKKGYQAAEEALATFN